ncbi:MAG: MmcQ/YjbR family DNA-binding protein [Polyangiales bacterium]
MTPARFRKLALSLDGVEERPHMDRAAFRTKRKIFATLGQDRRVNLVIEPAERREMLFESFPEAFSSLGGWTRLGYVAVDLAKVEDELLRELVTDAWRDALPVRKARK